MKQQTPMQELIDIITIELEISKDIVQYSQQELDVFARVRNSAFYLLLKEKEHIIQAYLEGADYTNDEHVTFAKKYYNQKYK